MNPQNPQQNPNRQVQQELLQTSFGGVSQLGTTTPTTQQLGQQNHPQQLQGSAQQAPSQSLPQQQPFATQQSQVPQQSQQSLQQTPLQVERSPQLTQEFPQQGVQAAQQVPQYSQQAQQIPQQVPHGTQFPQQAQQFPQQAQQIPLKSQQVPQGTQQLPQQIQQYPQQAQQVPQQIQQVPQQAVPGTQLPQQQVPQFQQQGQQIPQQPIGQATSSWQTEPLTQGTLSGATGSAYSTPEMSQQAGATTQPAQAQTMGQPQQTHAGGQAQQAVGQSVGFSGMTGTQAGFSQTVSGQTGGTEIPAVDMFEGDDKFVLLANLAGYKSDEIELEASGETLRIVAARQDKPEEDLRPLQRERLNRAERVVQLPSIVDVDDAEATCKNGVCRITLPKAAEASNRRIGVQ